MEPQNYSFSKATSLHNAQAIREICDPFLSSLNISGFTLQRIYKDGSRLYFSNSEKWIEHFYTINYFQASSYAKYNAFDDVILWKSWPQKDKLFLSLIQDAKENFQYENGLYVCKKNEHYLDAFSFRGHVNDDDINHRYLSNFPSMDKFMDYFLIRARNLISDTFKKRFTLPERIDVLPLTQSNNFHLEMIKEFKRSNLLIDNNGTTFSERESECIYLMCLGKTAKEVAIELNISFRTVEAYLNNIRFKLNCVSKSQIPTKILASKTNKELILNFFKLI